MNRHSLHSFKNTFKKHGKSIKNIKMLIFCLFAFIIMNLESQRTALLSFKIKEEKSAMKMNHKRIVFLVENQNSKADNFDKIIKKRVVPKMVKSTLAELPLTQHGDPNIPPFETKECKAIKKWQYQSFPSCNSMHELDLSSISNQAVKGKDRLGGAQASLWKHTEKATNVTAALRTMRYNVYDFTPYLFHQWRIDNLALERLTFSRNVMDIYGYYGTSGLYELSNYPNLGEQINWQKEENGGYPSDDIDTTQLLRIAVDITRGLADTHSFDGNYATLGHGDIALPQYIYVNGVYKLMDFNDGFLLAWDPDHKKVCDSMKRSLLHLHSSPEEYQFYKRSEKSDVFSFGYVLYGILTGLDPFQGVQSRSEVGKWLAKGENPFVPDKFLFSEDPVHNALVIAIDGCWRSNPEKRSSAREIANFLEEVLEDVEKERNSTGGKRWVANLE